MRKCFLVILLLIYLPTLAAKKPNNTWAELTSKRELLPGLHQEFEVTQTFNLPHGQQSSKETVVLDFSQRNWREQRLSGSGTRIRIFDGDDLFVTEEGDDEFTRTKHKAKDPDPAPLPYGLDVNWAKAKELEGGRCGFAENDHACMLLDVPVKPWIGVEQSRRMLDGMARFAVDTETGMIVRAQMRQTIQDRNGGYEALLTYSLKKAVYGETLQPSLFKLAGGDLHEVKELTPWTVARVKKQLVGKPAPALDVTDLQGDHISLSDLKGKVVLLDFWTTWCPPCLADGPAIEKLYRKYSHDGFMVVSISMSEDRHVVEKFLRDHPRSFPVVLSSENNLPRPYQVGAFPTYMVISAEGTLTSVADGDQGFGELQKSLKKAGMEVN